MENILLFGTNWSVETWDLRRVLDTFQIPYDYLDIETNDKAAVWLREKCGGQTALPCLYLPNGEFLITPTHATLAETFGISFIGKNFRSDTKPLVLKEPALAVAV